MGTVYFPQPRCLGRALPSVFSYYSTFRKENIFQPEPYKHRKQNVIYRATYKLSSFSICRQQDCMHACTAPGNLGRTYLDWSQFSKNTSVQVLT